MRDRYRPEIVPGKSMEVDNHDSVRRVLWPVKTEAATVIAEMRQNAKWASSRPAVCPVHVTKCTIYCSYRLFPVLPP